MSDIRKTKQQLIEELNGSKKVEESLLQSEAGYRNLFENSMMGISQVFPDGRIIHANEAYVRMYGYDSLEEMMREVPNVGSLYAYPEDRQRVLSILKEKSVVEPREYAVVRRDGTKFFALIGVREVRDSHGNLYCYQAEHIDITELQKAKDSLIISKENLLRAQRIGHLGNWIWDTKNNTLEWSKELYRIWGVDENFKLTFENIENMIHPLDREKNMKKVQELFHSADSIDYEFRIIRSGGDIRHIYQSIEISHDDGLIFGTMQDITEHKRVKNALSLNQKKLQQLNIRLRKTEEYERRKIAIFLHDNISQALAVINMKFGSLQIMNDSMQSNNIIKDIRHLLEQTIENARSLTFELSPPILYELGLEPALEWLCEKVNREHDIHIKFITGASTKTMDQELKTILYRSVQELLMNIVKYAHANMVSVCVEYDADFIKIVVDDDGIGFNPHAENELDTDMGFGLFSIREQLIHIGGNMVVESSPGKGSHISLTAQM